MITHFPLTTLMALLGAAVFAGGCQWGGPRDFTTESDRLRRENIELRQTVDRLRQQTANIEQALATERRRGDPSIADLPEGVEPPMVTRITIGRFSGGLDSTGDGADDTARIYISTLDARSRFVPTVATARVTVLGLPPGDEPVTMATAEFNAQQFEQSYRSGLTGTHYTLVVPVTREAPERLDRVLVRVRINDLLTGEQHTAESSVRWDPGPERPAADPEADGEADGEADREADREATG